MEYHSVLYKSIILQITAFMNFEASHLKVGFLLSINKSVNICFIDPPPPPPPMKAFGVGCIFLFLSLFVKRIYTYCNRTNFRTRFNFVYFVLLAESTKFSSIRKPYTYTSVSDTTVAVRKFLAYESRQTLEYEIFTRTKISAITVIKFFVGGKINLRSVRQKSPSTMLTRGVAR